ncbi:hypothetical protein, partial [Fangia hongkongensis]
MLNDQDKERIRLEIQKVKRTIATKKSNELYEKLKSDHPSTAKEELDKLHQDHLNKADFIESVNREVVELITTASFRIGSLPAWKTYDNQAHFS